MKCSGLYERIWIAGVSCAMVLSTIVLWLVAMPATSHCPEEEPTNIEQYRAHPVKVVVKPWYGRHQVYGIFVVPLRYRSGRSYFGTISVAGFKDELFPDWQPRDQRVEDVIVEPGYYLIRGYIPTRIAIRFFLTGQLSDLRTPCNWTLEFVKRAPS